MGTTGDMLGTGVSALLAFQRSLSTTSHNISNVNTEGYNRQTVSLSTRLPQPSGNGFIGTGVQALTVQRVYSDFINTQVLVNSASSGRLDSYHQLASQVDNLLADSSTGLSYALCCDGYHRVIICCSHRTKWIAYVVHYPLSEVGAGSCDCPVY